MDPASGIPHGKKKDRVGIGFFLPEVTYSGFGKKPSLRILRGAVILPKSIPIISGGIMFYIWDMQLYMYNFISAAVEHVMTQLPTASAVGARALITLLGIVGSGISGHAGWQPARQARTLRLSPFVLDILPVPDDIILPLELCHHEEVLIS